MQDSQFVADRIKDIAKSRNTSIANILIQCGLNKNTIFTMQTRNYFPRIETIWKIADYLNVSVDYLLGRTDRPEVNK